MPRARAGGGKERKVLRAKDAQRRLGQLQEGWFGKDSKSGVFEPFLLNNPEHKMNVRSIL